jgi:hypothetical protein
MEDKAWTKELWNEAVYLNKQFTCPVTPLWKALYRNKLQENLFHSNKSHASQYADLWAHPLANYNYNWNVFSESGIPDSTIPASLQLVLPSGLCSCRKDTVHTFHGTLYVNCLWLESYGPKEVSSCMFLCFCGITSLLSSYTLNLHVYKFSTLKEGCIFICLGRIHMYTWMWGYVRTCMHVHTCVCAWVHTCLCERKKEVEGVSYFNLHVLIFTPVDHPMTKPFSASVFRNIPAVCIHFPYSLFYIYFTWSFYLMLIFIFQVMKGILLSFMRNTWISVTYPIFL